MACPPGAAPALRLAAADGERYAPLYEHLDDFTRASGRPVEIAARLPPSALEAHLRETAMPYDVVCSHGRYTPGLAGLLLPLDGLLPPGELSDFAEPALELCRWDGRVYQLPRSVETRLLYYRSDLFEDPRERRWFAEASGGRELRVPRTWEELAAAAQYFTRAGKCYGFIFPGRGPGLVATFAEMSCGLMMDKARSTQIHVSK